MEGELVIYSHGFILGQLTINQPEDIDEYNCKKDKVKLVPCLCDKSSGEFLELKLQLAYITLHGDVEESFLGMAIVTRNQKSCIQLLRIKFSMQ